MVWAAGASYEFIFTPTKTVELTLGEVFDAIEKNGLTQAFGTFLRYDNSTGVQTDPPVIGACAIGQAAVNLNVSYDDLLSALNRFSSGEKGIGLGRRIVRMNDVNRRPFAYIARHFRREFKHDLDNLLTVVVQEYKVAEAVSTQ